MTVLPPSPSSAAGHHYQWQAFHNASSAARSAPQCIRTTLSRLAGHHRSCRAPHLHLVHSQPGRIAGTHRRAGKASGGQAAAALLPVAVYYPLQSFPASPLAHTRPRLCHLHHSLLTPFSPQPLALHSLSSASHSISHSTSPQPLRFSPQPLAPFLSLSPLSSARRPCRRPCRRPLLAAQTSWTDRPGCLHPFLRPFLHPCLHRPCRAASPSAAAARRR